jgi:hypothetical protein
MVTSRFEATSPTAVVGGLLSARIRRTMSRSVIVPTHF